MITIVRLYGKLGKQFGRTFKLDIAYPRQAIDLIESGKPGFMRAILDMPDYKFRVKVGDRVIDENELLLKHSAATITITPVLEGAASGKSIGSLIAGVALVAVGIILAGTPLGWASPYIIGMGLSLTLSGVAGLLAPTPKTQFDNEPSKNKPSFQFSGPVNVVAAGGPVPVKYGYGWVGSVVVSAGVLSKDITQGSNVSGTSGGTGVSNMGGGEKAVPAFYNHHHL